MWGSTKANTPDECTWAKAPFNGGNTNYNADAFNQVKDTVCPNGILAKKYDAAAQIMGSDWRIPTSDELQELITYTNNEWIGNFDGNGTSGYKFTSKKDTSNYIFIPASERYKDFSTYIRDISYGVWSSSLYTSYPREAWTLDFNSKYIEAEDEYTCPYDRYYGMAVRGVL